MPSSARRVLQARWTHSPAGGRISVVVMPGGIDHQSAIGRVLDRPLAESATINARASGVIGSPAISAGRTRVQTPARPGVS